MEKIIPPEKSVSTWQLKTIEISWARCTPLIQALGRQRQVDLCYLEASPIYIAGSRTVSQSYIMSSNKQTTKSKNKQNKKIPKTQPTPEMK